MPLPAPQWLKVQELRRGEQELGSIRRVEGSGGPRGETVSPARGFPASFDKFGRDKQRQSCKSTPSKLYYQPNRNHGDHRRQGK
jgi:hypothetical protein